MREFFEVLHDLAHPLGPVVRFRGEVFEVFEDEVQVHFLFFLRDLVAYIPQLVHLAVVDLFFQRVVGFEQVGEILDVLSERGEVAEDEAHRVVDLVGHAGGQLADGGQFLGLEQLGLVLLEQPIGLLQLVLALPQFLLGLLVLGDVHGRALAVEQVALGIPHGAGVFRDPPFAAVPAADLDLEIRHQTALFYLANERGQAFGIHVELMRDVGDLGDHFLG